MSNIPSVEEFLEREYVHIEHEPGKFVHESDFKKSMLEFAALHVQAALKAASEKATTITAWKKKFIGLEIVGYEEKVVYERSILEAYPLKNIK